MKTLLLTGYDKQMSPIGELTAPLMKDYAKKHGIHFRCWTELTGVHTGYWEKVPQVLIAFDDGYDRVIWLDADQMITNPEQTPWLDLESGFHASRDWGADAIDGSYFSMCGFVVCRDAAVLFEWLEKHKADWVDKPFPEQAPMRYLYNWMEKEGIDVDMDSHRRQVFNAVPSQIHESVVEPWDSTCWCAHITMLDVPRRVEIFHELEAQCAGH